MPKRTAATITAAALILLTLAGCAGTPEEAPSEPRGFVQSVPSQTAEPLVAEATEPAEVGTDTAYLEQLRKALEGSGGNSIPDATDEQLVTAGHEACEQMLSGVDQFDVRVVENEPETGVGYKDSLRIAGAAIKHFCPDARTE